MTNSNYRWKPHKGPQEEFLRRSEFEVLFGGAAGPGKTDCLIMAATRHVDKPRYHAMIMRRTFPELSDIIDRTREYYPYISKDAIYRKTEKRWLWPSGAIISFGHMEHPDDKFKYQGKEFQFVGFDEVCQFEPEMYLYLHSRCRSTDPTIKPMVRATTNPGGVGHQFFKDRFVTITKPGSTYIDPVSGLARAFIPAKIYDNPTLIDADPAYLHRLMLLPKVERERLLEGSWDSFEGQGFPELSKEIHGIEPFDIPPEWPRFRTFDWGYSKPFSVGWWAVDNDDNIYRYSYLYGCADGERDKGIRWTPSDIARRIQEVEATMDVKVKPGPADPSIWHKNPLKRKGGQGISVAEEMQNLGVTWLIGDNARVLGKQQFHERLRIKEDGYPSLFVFNNDEPFWRTVPHLQLSITNPEDINDKSEDHVYDELRYACMHRPMKVLKIANRPPAGSFDALRSKHIRATKLSEKRGITITDAYGRV